MGKGFALKEGVRKTDYNGSNRWGSVVKFGILSQKNAKRWRFPSAWFDGSGSVPFYFVEVAGEHRLPTPVANIDVASYREKWQAKQIYCSFLDAGPGQLSKVTPIEDIIRYFVRRRWFKKCWFHAAFPTVFAKEKDTTKNSACRGTQPFKVSNWY